MQMVFKLLTLAIWASFYFVKSNALDISTATSIFSTKNIKCYKCSSLFDDDCKNNTNVKHRLEFQDECKPDAKGCVKQFVTKSNGKTATFRECYYGNISPIFTTFECENIYRSAQYDEVKCYKCKGDLCNNSNRLKHSAYGIMLFTLTVMLLSFMLKI